MNKIKLKNKQTNKRKTKGEKTKQNFFNNFPTQTIRDFLGHFGNFQNFPLIPFFPLTVGRP